MNWTQVLSSFRRFGPLVVFIAVPTLLILPFAFSGRMLFGSDVVMVFHYQRVVISEAFREGRLPVWDPHVMAGFPLLAGVQGAVFYPPTWLCVVLPAGAFWTVSAWFHFILAGLFAHRWLERGLGVGPWAALAGGFVYMMSGYIVGHAYAGHVNYVWAYPWMAALLWRFERFLAAPTRKRGVLLAVVLAMLFLAGVPQYVYFAAVVMGLRGIHFVGSDPKARKPRAILLGKAAAWLAMGLLLCAPQLFPTLELVGEMHRGTEDPDFAVKYSLPPEAALEIVWPLPPNSRFWEQCAYLSGGAVLLLAAAFAQRRRQQFLWLGIALFGLLMAMGHHTPLYPGVVRILPGAEMFRGAGRYLLLFTLGATVLIALGFQGLWDRKPIALRFLACGLGLAAAVQLGVFAVKFIQPTEVWRLDLFPGLTKVQAEIGPSGRIATTMSVDDIGKCQAAGVDTLCGYEPMMLRRYAELMNAAQGYPAGKSISIMASVGEHPIVDMLGVKGWLMIDHQSRPNPTPFVKPNPGALPRAWLVNNAVVIESREARLKVLGKGPWDPRKTVILEEFPTEAPPVPTEAPAGRAKVLSRKPGEYLLEAENDADAFLVLSEAYYPGWRADVDGRPVDVLPANHLIQAVRLPPGKHVVRFAYRSRYLGVGVAVAFLAAFAPVVVELVRRRRR
jgi:hypothetical protein